MTGSSNRRKGNVMTTEVNIAACHVLCQLVRCRIAKTCVLIVAMPLLYWLLVFLKNGALVVNDNTANSRHVVPKMEVSRTGITNRTRTDHLPISEAGNKTNVFPTNAHESDKAEILGKTEIVDKCQYPVIDPFEPSVIALTKYHPPINCEKGVPHLVYMSGYTITVNHSRTALYANTTHPFKECRYKSIMKEPGSDFNTIVIYTSEWFKDEITPREIDDNLVVECLNTNNTVISRSYFTLIRIKFDLELELESKFKKHLALNSPKEVLNVLMIGLDGNSKQNLERHMPKTRNFLLNELKALELHKYNKVGDSTYPNLCPLLAAKTYKELQRDKWKFHDHFDFVNEDFLWSDFRRVGYRTGVFFDDNFVTAFHFHRKGWDKPPADYYMRAAILERNKDKLMTTKDYHCSGDIPEITSNLDFWIQMASTFNNSKTKPYFGFSFSTHLTHDEHNMASAGDHLYLKFFQELRDKNLINNTVVLFFSDHGQRFGQIRSTYNGMLESKMPHIFLVFPPWFHQKYPELIKVLKINQERLTTNRDLHATIRDLANFQATTGKGDVSSRGISLFYEIPPERTCEHVEIPMELCVCHQMSGENVSTSMVLLLAEATVQKLAELIAPHSEKCANLNFDSMKSVMKIQSDTASNEEDKKDIEVYQMTMTTNPGNALYEATLKFRHSTKKVEVVGEVIRLNMYRGQAECIDDPKLRSFCFCKK